MSIIIPTRNQAALLDSCLASIFTKTSYPRYEVILVDNQTKDQEALDVFHHYPVRIVPYHECFNYSRANNLGAAKAKGTYLLFLNNDVEVITKDWLESLLYFTQMPDIGAVGGLLLYPDHTVQHAGVALGIRGTADHIMRGFPSYSDGHFGMLSSAHEVSAVTGACLMIKHQDYSSLGGMRQQFRSIYQDLDLCLRIRDLDRRNIFTPRARLYHHESSTRGHLYDSDDRMLIRDLWGDSIEEGDPYWRQ